MTLDMLMNKIHKPEDWSCGHRLTTQEKRRRSIKAVAFSKEHNLKKCPFCNRYPHGGHSNHIYCRCGASMQGEGAMRRWNKRNNKEDAVEVTN